MSCRSRLFGWRDPYDLAGTDALFVEAIRENAAFHIQNCSEYREILAREGFSLDSIRSIEDLWRLPVIPTLYFKRHELYSIPKRRMVLRSTSSGTSGSMSHIGWEWQDCVHALRMVWRVTRRHHLLSPKPTNYIVLGYQPHRSNQTAISKTAFGFTFFATPLRREYALKHGRDGYTLDLDGLKTALLRYSRQPFPVRTMGFPAYTYFFLRELQKEGIRVKLHPDSRVCMGGGWKQFYAEKVEKEELYALAEEVLSIPESRCHEFFGAVEHPILYADCRKHHFHVPVYARVIIRDVRTLEPLPMGETGLVNLLTPMVRGVPLTSVMTDDLGVLHPGGSCGCGCGAPWLEIIGRVGLRDIKTCAAGAAELLGGVKI